MLNQHNERLNPSYYNVQTNQMSQIDYIILVVTFRIIYNLEAQQIIDFLNYAEKNIELLSENEKYSVVNIENEKFIFVKEFKCFFPIKLDPSYLIKQYKLNLDKYSSSKGSLILENISQDFLRSDCDKYRSTIYFINSGWRFVI